jgi:hypothetical protein
VLRGSIFDVETGKSLPATLQTTLDSAKSFAAKTFTEAAQAYPQVAELYASAQQVYASPPSVDQAFDQALTTIQQTAPSVVSLVQSQLDKIPNRSPLTEVDKAACLTVLAISVLAVFVAGLWLLKKFFSFLLRCLFGAESGSVSETVAQKSPKAARKSVSPKRSSRKAVEAEAEETEAVEPEAETAAENATKTRRTATKTPRMRTPKASAAAETVAVESATPAPAKVLDFGVTPKKGATPKIVEESASKKVSKAEENATPRRSSRLAALAEHVPMPAVEESEPVNLPAENPTYEWEKLTVPDLKAELKRRGEKVGQQRKAELVERLQALDKENHPVQ